MGTENQQNESDRQQGQWQPDKSKIPQMVVVCVALIAISILIIVFQDALLPLFGSSTVLLYVAMGFGMAGLFAFTRIFHYLKPSQDYIDTQTWKPGGQGPDDKV